MSATETAAQIVRDHPAVARAVVRMMKKSEPRAGLTARMRELLEFIEAYHDQKQIMPSYDEMREAVGLASKAGVHRLITSLEERGHVRRIYHKARSLELVS